MGRIQKMANFNKYLNEACYRICGDEEIAKLLLGHTRDPLKHQLGDIDTIDELMWSTVFPYSFVPEATTDEKCIIMVDLDNFELDRVQSVKRGYLVVDILCHEKLMRTIYGTRTGMLINRVDRLFNNVAFSLGASRLKFHQAYTWDRQPRQYIGYKIVYELLDVN